LGLDAILRMLRDPFPIADATTLGAPAACRAASARRVKPVGVPPPFDEATLRLGAALHDLLALGHPELGGARSRRADRVAAAAIALHSLDPPRSAREAVTRHALLARLPEIVRVDRTVFFWAGRQTYVGRRPPPRGTAPPPLRARATQHKHR